MKKVKILSDLEKKLMKILSPKYEGPYGTSEVTHVTHLKRYSLNCCEIFDFKVECDKK